MIFNRTRNGKQRAVEKRRWRAALQSGLSAADPAREALWSAARQRRFPTIRLPPGHRRIGLSADCFSCIAGAGKIMFTAP
jgi:hypothetical protein